MKTRILGKSNLKVSSIGMGCWAIGGPFYHKGGHIIAYGHVNDKDSLSAIEKGLELGVTIFDTANVYGLGRSETILGKALKGKREDVVIATKFGTTFDFNSGDPDVPGRIVGRDHSPEGIRKACDESLKRLQTNYIDFYQIHSGNMSAEEASIVVNTLEELVEEGKIRYYGWSTDDPERARLISQGKHCTGMQFRINFTQTNQKMFELIDELNFGGLIKGPLAGGIFTGKYNAESKLPKEHGLSRVDFSDERYVILNNKLDQIKELMTNDGRTLPQGALGYVLAQHERIIPIPGFKTAKQVEENVRTIELGPLSKKLVQQIDDLFSEFRKDHSEIQRG
ncbi:MAG: aldo/keto reductase [Asgard group archaeon]|nr:aldo/keto reductase [Asgard group archaeon]